MLALKLLLLSSEINMDFNQMGCSAMTGDREQPEFGENVLLCLGINSVSPLMQSERIRNGISVPGMNLSINIYVSP